MVEKNFNPITVTRPYLYAIAALDGPANGTIAVDLNPTIFAQRLKSANV